MNLIFQVRGGLKSRFDYDQQEALATEALRTEERMSEENPAFHTAVDPFVRHSEQSQAGKAGASHTKTLDLYLKSIPALFGLYLA